MKFWRALWGKTSRYPLIAIVFASFILGIVFWGGFNTFMEYTNTMGFCISCHEMKDNVYEEYTKTSHYQNASGVRATCSDCHVPKDWTAKLVRKIKATGELYHSILGTIDTPEKFDAHRLTMAKRVWAEMEENDSRECRNCHSWHAMDFSKQSAKSAKQMQQGMENQETCISCHKGVAHKLPDMSSGYKKKFEELVALSQDKSGNADQLTAIAVKSLYVAEDAAKQETQAAGRLLAPTKVDVLERSGDVLKIRISGWQQDQVDRIIYELQGQRIFSAALSNEASEKIKRLETVVDPDTELTWHRVELDVWTDKSLLVEDTKPVWEYAKELYSGSCSTCHSVHSPAHSLANQWIGTMKAMERFITLDKDEYRFLLKYLQLNARDTGGKGSHD